MKKKNYAKDKLLDDLKYLENLERELTGYSEIGEYSIQRSRLRLELIETRCYILNTLIAHDPDVTIYYDIKDDNNGE